MTAMPAVERIDIGEHDVYVARHPLVPRGACAGP